MPKCQNYRLEHLLFFDFLKIGIVFAHLKAFQNHSYYSSNTFFTVP